MGYEYAELNQEERLALEALMRYPDGVSVWQLEAETGLRPAEAAIERLSLLGYVLAPGREPGDVWELLSRGWRWITDTARNPDAPKLFADADTTERVYWAFCHRFTLYVEGVQGFRLEDVFHPGQPLRLPEPSTEESCGQ